MCIGVLGAVRFAMFETRRFVGGLSLHRLIPSTSSICSIVSQSKDESESTLIPCGVDWSVALLSVRL